MNITMSENRNDATTKETLFKTYVEQIKRMVEKEKQFRNMVDELSDEQKKDWGKKQY